MSVESYGVNVKWIELEVHVRWVCLARHRIFSSHTLIYYLPDAFHCLAGGQLHCTAIQVDFPPTRVELTGTTHAIQWVCRGRRERSQSTA